MKSYRFQHLIKQIQNNKLKNNMKKNYSYHFNDVDPVASGGSQQA